MSAKSAYLKLPLMKRRFVDLLVQRKTPTDAIREIKPHVKHPRVLASKWRSLPEVQAALEEREAEAIEEAGITSAQILLGIAATADFDIRKLVNPDGSPKSLHELDDDAARVVQAVKFNADGSIEFKLPNRNEARKMLGQYKKLFTEKHEHEHSGPNGGPIPTESRVSDPVEAARQYAELMGSDP